ncbi:MAG: ATP-dependent Clp protease proteolytic subunit [Verrucomicrobiales bacterium]|jgi:ATP-dependent protease ClpP protease subunit|nr:ATP-dependent Clp protease proteolytic subunit [Verrucomicrobiales bacterium]
MVEPIKHPGNASAINLQRAVYVNMAIDEPLTARLTPEILRLRAESSEPITLFIDSLGGSTDSLSYLLDILRATIAGQQRCPIITQVIGHASSAAAVLLVNGDYAIAYPHATIHFHGVRVSEAQNLTVEEANRFAAQLERINKENAYDLSQRFVRRILRLYAEFLHGHERPEDDFPSAVAEIDFFFSTYLADKVSPMARQILTDAALQARDSTKLLQKIRGRLADIPLTEESAIETHAAILHEVILHEIRRLNVKQGQLTEDMLAQISGNYLAICNYFLGDFDAYVESLTYSSCNTLLNRQEREEFSSAFPGQSLNPDNFSPEQKEWLLSHSLRVKLGPLFGYTLYLCQRLQKDENALSAQDAYWLGVVDKVLAYDLPTDRKTSNEEKNQP